MEDKSGIYKITNKHNGKIYIGSAVSFIHRFRGHLSDLRKGKHHSRHLQNSWDKYGEESFSFDKLILCEKKNLILYEQLAIDSMRPEYNMSPTAGSPLGSKRTEETKKKIGEITRNRASDPVYLQAMSERTKDMMKCAEMRSHLSKKTKQYFESEENRKLSSERSKAKWADPAFREKEVARRREMWLRKGEEIGRKISESNKNSQKKADGNKRAALLHKEKWKSPEYREKMKAARKDGHKAGGLKRRVHTEQEVLKIKNMLSMGIDRKIIAAETGANQSMISKISLGKSYKDIGDK